MSIVNDISVYRLESDKSDQIIPELIRLLKVTKLMITDHCYIYILGKKKTKLFGKTT